MMATKSKIEWTDATWNPITGCTKISPGCAHCYAERMAYRFAGCNGYPERPHHFDVTLHPDRLEQPLNWRKPRRVFVCSMSDLFHDDVPDEYIGDVWQTMFNAREHTFQVLTKRPQRMLEWLRDYWLKSVESYDEQVLPNVWLGVTCENQEQADKRITYLLQTPAAVRFVSVEPMLGPVDLVAGIFKPGVWDRIHPSHDFTLAPTLLGSGLDWVICGGESGPGARPMHPDWVRSLRDQCQEAGTPFLFKQWGAHNEYGQRVGKKHAGRLLDGREWNEFPA